MNTFIDERGGVYTADGKVLLRCPDVKWYRVREGTEDIAPDAFHHCPFLGEVELPYTFKVEDFRHDVYEKYGYDVSNEEYWAWQDWLLVFLEDKDDDKEKWSEADRKMYAQKWYEFWSPHKFLFPDVGWGFWNSPYAEEDYRSVCCQHDIEEGVEDEYGVIYSKNGHWVLAVNDAKFATVEEYTVREGVITLCEQSLTFRGSWAGMSLPLTVHLPKSLQVIGQDFVPLYFKWQGKDLVYKHEEMNERRPPWEEDYYTLTDPEELERYYFLKSDVTGLPVDLYVDVNFAFIYYKHCQLLFICNGDGLDLSEYIPIALYDPPHRMDWNTPLYIPEEAIEKVLQFTALHQDLLNDLAQDYIPLYKFLEVIKNSRK